MFIAGRLVTGVFHTPLRNRYYRRLFGSTAPVSAAAVPEFPGRAGALVALLFLILCFGIWFAHTDRMERSIEDLNARLTVWMRTATSKNSRLPIVVANPIMYLPLAYGAAKDLRDVVVYMPDGHEASRYGRLSTADYNLAGLCQELLP